MPFTDAPRALASTEQRLVRTDEGRTEVGQDLVVLGLEERTDKRRGAREDTLPARGQALGIGVHGNIRPLGSRAVECGEPAGESVHRLEGRRSAHDQIHEDPVGRKAPHPDHMIDGVAAPAQPQGAAGLARDRHNAQVDRWGQPPVQPHFFPQKWWRSAAC